MLTVTSQAVEKLKNILEEQGQAASALRVIVVPSGDGAQYMLSVETDPSEDDVVLSQEGLRVVLDTDSAPLVEEAEIDYVEDLMRSGFVINNPSLPPVSGGGCGGGGGGCACGGNCACGGH